MNIEQARFNMIEQQIRPWDVLDTDILDLLMVVKRENFVPEAYRKLAFVDTSIPLPGGSAMLNPKIEARIAQDVHVKKHENVLLVGAGSGYLTALLAHRARHVTAVEIDPALKDMAQKNLAANGITNVTVELGNGAQGWSNGAPFDVIVFAGALPVLPETVLQQIKPEGRILAIIGESPVMSAHLITRTGESSYDTKKLFETDVKPLHAAVTPSHFTF